MLALTDIEIIKSCLEGNHESFSELVARYKRLIYSTVNYYIKDREDVEDLYQEAFVRIYKGLKSYKGEYKFSTWAVKITKNLCLDFLRKRKANTVSIDEYEFLSKDEDSPENQYIRQEQSVELHRLIDRLPEKYRSLLLMYHENEASYKEMAEKFKQPLTIIKNRLYRGRMALKKDLLNAQGIL